MTYNIVHREGVDDLFYRNNEGIDFISPATQESLKNSGNPLWRPTFSSRCPHLPMWDRPDMFREITYHGTRRMNYQLPKVEHPSLVVSPSGELTLRNTLRSPSVVVSDRELYHPDVQKVFSVMIQFDTMTEHQLSAFTGIRMERLHEVMLTLYAAEIVEAPSPDWEYQEKFGTPWRLNPYSARTTSYLDGMSPLNRMITAGNIDMTTSAPPGAGSSESIRHNLFSAEIALRVAESSDLVAGVWGDLFASENLFHEHRDDARTRNSHGDAVIVTKDGSIIIIEVVGSVMDTGNKFQAIVHKAASWIGVISNSLLDISVLFIDTSWARDRKNVFNAVDIGVKRESAAYAPDNVLRERAQKKIGIVNAAWWFPEDGTMSQAGTRLGGYSPVEQRFKAFDRPDNFYSTEEHRRDTVLNTVSAMHTPPWMTKKMKDRY